MRVHTHTCGPAPTFFRTRFFQKVGYIARHEAVHTEIWRSPWLQSVPTWADTPGVEGSPGKTLVVKHKSNRTKNTQLHKYIGLYLYFKSVVCILGKENSAGIATWITFPAAEDALQIFCHPGCQATSQEELSFNSPPSTLSTTTRSSLTTCLPTPCSPRGSSGKNKRL